VPLVFDELCADIPALMDHAHVPGLSLALIEAKGLTHRAVFGVEHRARGVPVTSSTVFQAASLSKPVFAVIVARLVELGALGLDVPLASYLPAPYVADDDLLEHVTARHVLAHTTGWPNWRPAGQPLRREAAPGERYGYSGEGYVYLQTVVEQLTGERLEALAGRHVFDPLAMRHSSFVWAPPGHPGLAAGHDRDGAPTAVHVGERAGAASSLHTTPGDYARFLEAVLDPSHAAWSVSPASVAELLQPQVTVNARVSWGLGWGLEEHPQGAAVWHWGDNPGYKSFVIGLPQAGSGVVVMTNGDAGRALCGQVVQRVLGTDHPALAWLASRYPDPPPRAERQ